jgi:hypothetical protein
LSFIGACVWVAISVTTLAITYCHGHIFTISNRGIRLHLFRRSFFRAFRPNKKSDDGFPEKIEFVVGYLEIYRRKCS